MDIRFSAAPHRLPIENNKSGSRGEPWEVAIARSVISLAASLLALTPNLARSQGIYSYPYLVSTLAGKPFVEGYAGGSADGTGSSAQFNDPLAVAVDGSGNILVADMNNNTIRSVSPSGVVTTIAGSPGVQGSADGTGSSASFNEPGGIAVDSSGNIFVCDIRNGTIRKIAPGGIVTTLAGAAGLTGSADGSGSNARFQSPEGIAVDSAGNLYVADVSNDAIRKVTQAGTVTTFAGTLSQPGESDGTGSSASFTNPDHIAIDSQGNLYVTEESYFIRKITKEGAVTTIFPISDTGYRD
jgi:sugar lactone lactonase YvrE